MWSIVRGDHKIVAPFKSVEFMTGTMKTAVFSAENAESAMARYQSLNKIGIECVMLMFKEFARSGVFTEDYAL